MLRKIIIKTISTFFYVGYLPLVPGTFGSICGIFLFFLIKDSVIIYAVFTCVLIAFGFLVTRDAEKLFGEHDPKYIVIDEVSGMLLSLIFIPYDLKLVIIAFILFRILDTLKPYPAGVIEKLKGGIGVMGDDIVAGIYTNIVLQIVLRLPSFRIS